VFLIVAVVVSAQDIGELRADAQAALASGQYYRAVELWGRALEINANDLASNVGIAEAYFWLGEYDQAQLYAERSRMLSRRDPAILTLNGRIAIGLGDLALAREHFEAALRIEPNNPDAEIGIAELAIAEGKNLDAVRALERTLRVHPEHQKALLSLVLVYEQTGNLEAAREYLSLALESHGDRPEVHILAAEYELRHGDAASAARHARTAQALAVDNTAAARIRALAAVLEGNYAEAVATTGELLAADRTDATVWYLRGIAQSRSGEWDDGMQALLTALRYSPDNEIIRFVAEDLAIDGYAMDETVRADLAAYVTAQAELLTDGFQYRKALAYFQRALRLTPFDGELRLRYADLHRAMGNDATYLSELEVARENGADRPALETEIAVFRNALSDSVSRRWGVDQFAVVRERTRLGVYMREDAGPIDFPYAGPALGDSLVRILGGLPRIEVTAGEPVTEFSVAFAEARAQDVDFFVLIDAQNSSRSFALTGTMFVARTGTAVQNFLIVRTGPTRVSDAMIALAGRIEDLYPLRARVLERRGNRLVLDAGSRDGLAAGTEMPVLAAESLLIEPDRAGYAYSPRDVLGRATVVTTDDLISEAVVAIQGLTDAVAPGDLVVQPGDAVVEREGDSVYPILYDRIRELR
jgi:tetratricopeptide (TPR) repeat protein